MHGFEALMFDSEGNYYTKNDVDKKNCVNPF